IDEYYIDAVIQELSKLNIDLNREIHVHTYYDPKVQMQLSNAVTKHVDLGSELEVAGIITQPFTGNVMAMVGGKDYTISQYNRAIYSSRQVASTIKPLLY
ncbi:penicillin-binding protein, partial [Erysipelatoclostridium ramosum]|nr:penicillin-binding protein [Thomasclavelia ramosa]